MNIIELAREAGIFTGGHPMNPWSVYPSDLERFATLVRAQALEEAAERCNNMTLYGPVAEVQQRYNQAYWHCAAAIRQLKEQT